MSVTVSIPTPLRSFTGGQDSLELAGDTVGQVLDGLLAAHGGLKRHLLQEDGQLRNFVNLYLNETDIRHLSSTATPVRSGDVLTIVPSIAGGAPTVSTEPALSHAEVLRYSRHLLLPDTRFLDHVRPAFSSSAIIVRNSVGAFGVGSIALPASCSRMSGEAIAR